MNSINLNIKSLTQVVRYILVESINISPKNSKSRANGIQELSDIPFDRQAIWNRLTFESLFIYVNHD